jgi:hypothetical protein
MCDSASTYKTYLESWLLKYGNSSTHVFRSLGSSPVENPIKLLTTVSFSLLRLALCTIALQNKLSKQEFLSTLCVVEPRNCSKYSCALLMLV